MFFLKLPGQTLRILVAPHTTREKPPHKTLAIPAQYPSNLSPPHNPSTPIPEKIHQRVLYAVSGIGYPPPGMVTDLSLFIYSTLIVLRQATKRHHKYTPSKRRASLNNLENTKTASRNPGIHSPLPGSHFRGGKLILQAPLNPVNSRVQT